MARKAFVLGSNGPESFGKLKYAGRDADNVMRALSGPRCGFEVSRPDYGVDVYDVRRQLNQIVQGCSQQDTLICYFSGHGALEAGELYLLWDNSNENLFSTALPVADVVRALRRCLAQNVLLILDCCHAGGATGEKRGLETPISEIKIAPDNHLVLMASDRLEKAREVDELQGGFLTHHLCSALEENFYEADSDNDERLSTDDLMRWLNRCAVAHNERYGARIPIPYLFGRQRGESFYLTSDSADWKPFELLLPNGTTIVVQPVAPVSEIAAGVGKYPVTNAQYQAFLDDVGSVRGFLSKVADSVFSRRLAPMDSISEPSGEIYNFQSKRWEGPFQPWRSDGFSAPNQPVVCVSYIEALAYCRWIGSKLSKQFGRSWIDLPQGRLWNFAAVGTPFPEMNPASWLAQAPNAYYLGEAPAPVDDSEVRVNVRGVSDMLGNVWEWLGRGELAPPDFRGRGLSVPVKVAGGGYLDDLRNVEPYMRAAELPQREETRHSDLGFRVAAYLDVRVLPEAIRAKLRHSREVAWMIDSHVAFIGAGEGIDFE